MGEEQKMILKMIEDGKITAEEGLALLKELEKSTEKDLPSTEVKANRNEETEFEGTYNQPSFTDRFVEFIDTAVKKVKDFDIDFNFGPSEEIEQIFQHREQQVTEVDVSIENGSLTFIPWEERDVRVECKVKVYKLKDEEEARKEFMKKVKFEVEGGTLSFKSPAKTMKVNTVVYVPQHEYTNVKLYTFNGQIDVGTITTQSLEAKTVSGRLTFTKLDSKKVILETVNGKISINQLISEHTEAKTVNGSVLVNGSGGKVVVETLNGSIKYSLTETLETSATFKTTTGSIHLTIPEEMKTEGECKTIVGGITCDLPHLRIISEKKEVVSKSLTFVSNRDAETNLQLNAETRTGSIYVKN